MDPVDAYLDSLKELERSLGVKIRSGIVDWRGCPWTFGPYSRLASNDPTAVDYLIVRGRDGISLLADSRSSSRTYAGVLASPCHDIVHVVSAADELAGDAAAALRNDFWLQMEQEVNEYTAVAEVSDA